MIRIREGSMAGTSLCFSRFDARSSIAGLQGDSRQKGRNFVARPAPGRNKSRRLRPDSAPFLSSGASYR